jgi:ribosomal protein S27E
MTKDILSFIHCKSCIEKRRKDKLEIGLTDPFTLRVWCVRCNKLTADFTMAEPIIPRCDICGEEIGPGHTHH